MPPPKRISLTDPAATWTTAAGGPAFFAYSTNYLIDLKAGFILDVEASSAVSKHAEVEATKTMIDRVEDKFSMTPDRLVGDTNYVVAAVLGWRVDEKGIAPHVPVWDNPSITTVRLGDRTLSSMKKITATFARLGNRCDLRKRASKRIHIHASSAQWVNSVSAPTT